MLINIDSYTYSFPDLTFIHLSSHFESISDAAGHELILLLLLDDVEQLLEFLLEFFRYFVVVLFLHAFVEGGEEILTKTLAEGGLFFWDAEP